jgi:hypothetical protein
LPAERWDVEALTNLPVGGRFGSFMPLANLVGLDAAVTGVTAASEALHLVGRCMI